MRYLLLMCVSVLISLNVSAEKVKKEYDVKDFTSVSVSNGITLHLSQGDSESLDVIIDKKLEEYLVVDVVGGELKIKLKKRSWFNFSRNKNKVDAVVVVKDINKLSVSGGGIIKTDEIRTDRLAVNISGAGIIRLNAITNDLKGKISGGGIINLKGATAKMNLHISGGGKIESDMDATDAKASVNGGGILHLNNCNANTINTRISGGGIIKLYGRVKDLTLKSSGGGIVTAKELKAENCKLSMSGGGIASVYVSENLDISAHGGVIVKCYGNPSNVNKDVSGGCSFSMMK